MEANKENAGMGCTGRCERCNLNQRTYCAAQKAYYLEQELAEIKAIILSGGNGEISTIVAKENPVGDESSFVPVDGDDTEANEA